ncbi:MAG: superoxide dismutase [Chloroflexota bacterium]
MLASPRRFALALASVLVLSLAVAPAAGAHDTWSSTLPHRINLPTGFQPEGITSGPFGRIYAGSLANGAIWRGNVFTGHGRILVPGVTGRVALGIHRDGLGRLWVAGGPNGTVRVYSARGTLLRTYTFPTAGFLNDLVITTRAVYATDSFNQQLAVVPLGLYGRLRPTSAAHTLALTGAIAYTTGFNANGIVKDNGWLILVQSNTGFLFRVNPWTGVTRKISTGGRLVVNGDGLVIRGQILYVIRNFNNKVDVFRLGWMLHTATFLGSITKTSLDVPTTGTFAAGALWVVNARFTVANPTTAAYWITRLPSHP